MIEKIELNHPNDDDLRVEYQATQNSAQHHDNLIWSINSVVWAASLVLLGYLLKVTPDRSALLIVILVNILGILLIIKVWTYTFQLAKLKFYKYERCKEIEAKLGLQQHRTVKWPGGRQKALYSAVMSFFIVIWLIFAWIHLKILFCQPSMLEQGGAAISNYAAVINAGFGIAGLIVGAIITRINSMSMIKRQEFNKAASEFRASFVDYIYKIRQAESMTNADAGWRKMRELHTAAVVGEHEKAKIKFEPFIEKEDLPRFNAAWEQYRQWPERFVDQEDKADRKEMILRYIYCLLEYANPK